MGVLPRGNASSIDIFELWLRIIDDYLVRTRAATPDALIGAVAVDLSACTDAELLSDHLAVCGKFGVRTVFSSEADTLDIVRRVHDLGASVFCSTESIRGAEMAVSAGVDGISLSDRSGNLDTVIAAVSRIRSFFDGTVAVSCDVPTGSAVLAAETAGADLVSVAGLLTEPSAAAITELMVRLDDEYRSARSLQAMERP
jgi:nitronate monooxygenase